MKRDDPISEIIWFIARHWLHNRLTNQSYGPYDMTHIYDMDQMIWVILLLWKPNSVRTSRQKYRSSKDLRRKSIRNIDRNPNFMNQPEILEVEFGTMLITLFISFVFCGVLTYTLIWVRTASKLSKTPKKKLIPKTE